MDADGGAPLFLQVKEAEVSVLARYVGASDCAHEGERVVTGQRLMQAASDVFLGWADGPYGNHYYVRQLRDMKGSVSIDLFTPEDLTRYATLCGVTLARAHARSGDAAAIAGYLGQRRPVRPRHRGLRRRVRRPDRRGPRGAAAGRRRRADRGGERPMTDAHDPHDPEPTSRTTTRSRSRGWIGSRPSRRGSVDRLERTPRASSRRSDRTRSSSTPCSVRSSATSPPAAGCSRARSRSGCSCS